MRQTTRDFILISTLVLTTWSACAQPNLGLFNMTTDTSLVQFESEDQIYSLTAVADGNYPTILAKGIEGDFMLTATFGSVNEYANWEGIGWMVQTPGGFYTALLNSQFYVYVTHQEQRTGNIITRDNEQKFEIMQMERRGSQLIVRAAASGEPLKDICEIEDASMPEALRAGIFLGGERLVTAGIWNVRIEKPVDDPSYPATNQLVQSTVETIDVLTGIRSAVHTADSYIDQAQWVERGQQLLFQKDGEWHTMEPSYNATPVNVEQVEAQTFSEITRTEVTSETPDGQYTYYQSDSSGRMKIWRRSGTSVGTPITNDEFHDFYPHVSPDGYWVTFLSFPADIDPLNPPAYAPAMVRIMPVNGSEPPKVLAHLYGGTGSLNVPCWSSDSQSITFVSYSKR